MADGPLRAGRHEPSAKKSIDFNGSECVTGAQEYEIDESLARHATRARAPAPLLARLLLLLARSTPVPDRLCCLGAQARGLEMLLCDDME